RWVRLSVGGAPTWADDEPEHFVDVAAAAVLGPDWALRAGWGRAETIVIRPDGHIALVRPARLA
ncbi:MAG TPA: hypothetical protein VL551_19955, partial [Actinospica sp.]|nr:hypothetical protein [Actinospica sp.]